MNEVVLYVTYCLLLHGITWHCMALHGIAWYCMALHELSWNCMVIRGIAWNGMLLHVIPWNCMLLRGIVYGIVWHSWYCIVFYDMYRHLPTFQLPHFPWYDACVGKSPKLC